MKKTAVEFYAEGLENLQYNPLEKNGYINAKQRLFEQANEMFEQQLKDAYQTSHISMMTAKQYYNETYKQEQ
jgi:hypothetical protein